MHPTTNPVLLAATAPRNPADTVSRQEVAGLLEHTYRWLRAASAVVPAVAQTAPALTVAAQLYAAGQYPAARRQLSGVIAMVHQARQAYPALPPL
ncbi:hypothetical protein [Planobispora longispora]|uniref:Uncharacterized protein n=1 Tax=Planobispora longispora TaxID=28887 RepID=A0A8J3RKR0_9ACTN|nr:hypothetical protein [Planobispora longispora]BFE79823.1 hypothetical protein GCM10020093_024240 [Planobispora longispora]GIH76763.1 hypothetical protein Plo01_31920 [Planobispora longispora]